MVSPVYSHHVSAFDGHEEVHTKAEECQAQKECPKRVRESMISKVTTGVPTPFLNKRIKFLFGEDKWIKLKYWG